MKFSTGAFILLFSIVSFSIGLGASPLFDWDEINFAEAAREMLILQDWLTVHINFQPFWEKPPFFIWMQALSMHFWGVNEFGARFPNAIAGALTLLALTWIGDLKRGPGFGLLWAICYWGSFLPQMYFHSGIIDPTFNLFIFLGLTLAVNGFEQPQKRFQWFTIGGLFLGLAALTKGPVALLIALLTLTAFLERKRIGFWLTSVIIIFAVGLLAPGIWTGAIVAREGPDLFKQFILYQVRLFQTQDAGHGGPFFYHPLVLLIGCFPASLFFLVYLRRRSPSQWNLLDHFTKFNFSLFWVVLILFSIVQTKIIHYSSLCYFPLTYFAAISLEKTIKNGRKQSGQIFRLFYYPILFLLGGTFTAIPLLMLRPAWLAEQIDKPFVQYVLSTPVQWRFEWIIGLTFLFVALTPLPKSFGVRVKALRPFFLTGLLVQFAVVFIAPKISAYSQGPMLGFLEELQEVPHYVEPLGFKSYAQYFYGNRMPYENTRAYETNYLLNGTPDRPTFFIARRHKAHELKVQHALEELDARGGYVLFRKNGL